MEEVGDFSRLDLTAFNDEQQRTLLEGRVQAMKGSYGTTPGGIVAMMRVAKEICTKRNTDKVDLVIMHDAFAQLLSGSGIEIDLTQPETVDKAWRVVLD